MYDETKSLSIHHHNMNMNMCGDEAEPKKRADRSFHHNGMEMRNRHLINNYLTFAANCFDYVKRDHEQSNGTP